QIRGCLHGLPDRGSGDLVVLLPEPDLEVGDDGDTDTVGGSLDAHQLRFEAWAPEIVDRGGSVELFRWDPRQWVGWELRRRRRCLNNLRRPCVVTACRQRASGHRGGQGPVENPPNLHRLKDRGRVERDKTEEGNGHAMLRPSGACATCTAAFLPM